MRLGVHHVLDFLNQMNWLGNVFLSDGRVSMWSFHVQTPDPTPQLVSVRPEIVGSIGPELSLGAHLVFRDGVFGRVAFRARTVGESEHLAASWSELAPAELGGRLALPNGRWSISARRLYEVLLTPDGESHEGGSRGPEIRLRRDPPAKGR